MKYFFSLAMLSCAVCSAKAGTVSGTVRLAKGSAAGHAVVWLEGKIKSKPLKGFTVDQRDRAFIPHVSVVPSGTKITFPNNDIVYHNVFAEFDAKKFDLGMYPRGAKKEVTFNKPGLVALLCSVHSEMGAYIMVVDTPFYAICDGKGKYSIPKVEPGDYTLRVWHESGQILSKSVQVSSSDLTIDAMTSRK